MEAETVLDLGVCALTGVFLLLPDRGAPAALAVAAASPQGQPAGHRGLQLKWSHFILLLAR